IRCRLQSAAATLNRRRAEERSEFHPNQLLATFGFNRATACIALVVLKRRFTGRSALNQSLWLVGAIGIYIEIHDFDAARRLLVAISAVPSSFTELDLADI